MTRDSRWNSDRVLKQIELIYSAKGKRDAYLSLKQPENLGGRPNDDIRLIRKQNANTRYSQLASH